MVGRYRFTRREMIATKAGSRQSLPSYLKDTLSLVR
jgi:hypothetical protein